MNTPGLGKPVGRAYWGLQALSDTIFPAEKLGDGMAAEG